MEPSLFDDAPHPGAPLAHRMRPATFDDFLGQEHLLAPGKPLRESIERGTVGSMVFWGPPGSGKTTLAGLIARHCDRAFETFSAVTEGVPRVREIIKAAEARLARQGRSTVLFCDEIHRFNKAQQDAFLPHVEDGIITLIGATTENPSFELNSALLSRLRVFVLEPIAEKHVEQIVARAIRRLSADEGHAVELDAEALAVLARHAGGDARRALNAAEAVFEHVRAAAARPASPGASPPRMSAEIVATVLEKRIPSYDKSGEAHYNLISALHKSIRGSDADAALYWLARMLEAGEDPSYVLRRLVRMATEDIGLADPRALSVALAAGETYRFLGSPEGDLAIAEAAVYLATAPKSNSVYSAWSEAREAAARSPDEPVPLAIRNAPTRLMSELGYGHGYRYDHAEGGHAAGQTYLPPSLEGASWYRPTGHGFEKTLAERMEWWARRRKAASDD